MVLLSARRCHGAVFDGFAERVVAGAGIAGWTPRRVAAKYEVSRAWVHRLGAAAAGDRIDRAAADKRSFGGARCRRARKARLAALITARPDATLAELRDALPTTAALSTLWRTIDRLGFTVKKNGTRRRTTPA